MNPDPLRTALQQLVLELQPHDVKLIIGGGYGLVLRAQHMRATGARPRSSVPVVRGTEDIDCFLPAEIIVDGARTEVIRTALDRLGYTPIAKNFQFKRTIDYDGQERTTKVDFLAARVQPNEESKVKVDSVRIRPRSFAGLHARTTPEAFCVEEQLLSVDVSDQSSGLYVFLPHPFSFLILKLFALRDRLTRSSPDEGKYHALDMFWIWSMITEIEWGEAEKLRARFSGHPTIASVHDALQHLFADSSSRGIIALRDQARRQNIPIQGDDIEAFRVDLYALLGPI